MDSKLITKWIAVLRSGEYEQTRGQLVRKIGKEWSYCPLGVLCELAGMRKEASWGGMFLDADGKRYWMDVPDRLLSRDVQCSVMKLSDTEKRSFLFIADWLEQEKNTLVCK